MRLDHIIVAVTDLEQAMADYGELGFTVFYGGQHAGGATHNALICFADGSYIELIAPTSPDTPPQSSPYLGSGSGFAGFALLADDLAAVAKRLEARGLAFAGPSVGGRERADGISLQWETLFLQDSIAPFVITDVTPRRLRVPDDPQKLTHANRATGIGAVEVITPDATLTQAQYTALLGQPQRATLGNAEALRYALDSTLLLLRTAPVLDGVAQPAPVRCQLRREDDGTAAQFDAALTHGADFFWADA